MATKAIFLVCCVLLLAACHPSATEKQDVLDGMAFAQDNLPITGDMNETYLNFSNSGEFLRRSKYFKAGADYRALMIMKQIRQNVIESSSKDAAGEDDHLRDLDAKLEDTSNKLCSLTWDTLNQDLLPLHLSSEKFGDIVGDSNLPALMASNPYQ